MEDSFLFSKNRTGTYRDGGRSSTVFLPCDCSERDFLGRGPEDRASLGSFFWHPRGSTSELVQSQIYPLGGAPCRSEHGRKQWPWTSCRGFARLEGGPLGSRPDPVRRCNVRVWPGWPAGKQ